MSFLKEFLDRRAQNLSKKTKISSTPSEDLTDKLFWDTLYEIRDKIKGASPDAVEDLMTEVLLKLNDRQAQQFYERFKNLSD